MNILGNVKEPFLSEDRFEVTFTVSPPRYAFHLVITGAVYSIYYKLQCLNVGIIVHHVCLHEHTREWDCYRLQCREP